MSFQALMSREHTYCFHLAQSLLYQLREHAPPVSHLAAGMGQKVINTVHPCSDMATERRKSKKPKSRNVFEAIVQDGHEENFEPVEKKTFVPTDLPAGSQEKIELLRQRAELGVPLWHEEDRADSSGLVGGIRPRRGSTGDTGWRGAGGGR